jgi:putative ABC transport system permease protein
MAASAVGLALSLRMPARFARGQAAGLALTMVAIACGVALVCAIDLANRAALRAFVEVIDTAAGRAALQVSAGEGGVFSETVADDVGTVAGVRHALPVVRATVFTTDGSGTQLAVYGIDLTDAAAEEAYGLDAEGAVEFDDPLIFVSQPDSVAVTRVFAARRGLALGDTIELMTPTGRRRFTVRGLLAPHGVCRAHDGNLILMDLFSAETVFAEPGLVNGVDVIVEPDGHLSGVAEAISRIVPDGLTVATPAQRQADLHRVMRSLHVALDAMALFGLVAAFLITFNRLSTVFERRAWQLGVLRAVGARHGVLWRELVKESVVIGLVGVAMGIPGGIAVGRLILPVIATTASLAYKRVVPQAELGVSPISLLLAGGLGIGAAVLAAALPAWRVARVALAETVKSRGVEQPVLRGRAMSLLRGAVLAAIALVVAAQHVAPSAASGLAATGLIAVAIALAARWVVSGTAAALGAACRRLGGPVGRFASGNLSRNPRRAALTVGTVGVGLGCVVWFWTLAASFEGSVVTTLTAAVRADLVVSSSHVTSGYVEAPVDEEVMAAIETLPGVGAVVGSRVIDWPHNRRRIAIEAIDPVYFTRPDFGRWPLFGPRLRDVWRRVAVGEAVVASANFALGAGVRVGDTIVLETPAGALPLRVGGLTSAFESPEGTILMSREVYAGRWRDRRLNRIAVHLAPGVSTTEIRASITRVLGDRYDLRILSAAGLVDHYATQVQRAFAPLRVLAAMVLLVTFLGVADTLAAGVLERTREVGVLRAVGVQGRLVARMTIAEGILLGGLGLGLAVAGGLALAALWVACTMPRLLGWVLDLHLPWKDAPLLVALTAAVCAAAALLPARRAVQLSPQAALRHE